MSTSITSALAPGTAPRAPHRKNRLAGVPFYVDGTRGEAPQDAMEWIIDASLTAASLFALCVVVYTVGVALGLPPY